MLEEDGSSEEVKALHVVHLNGPSALTNLKMLVKMVNFELRLSACIYYDAMDKYGSFLEWNMVYFNHTKNKTKTKRSNAQKDFKYRIIGQKLYLHNFLSLKSKQNVFLFQDQVKEKLKLVHDFLHDDAQTQLTSLEKEMKSSEISKVGYILLCQYNYYLCFLAACLVLF